MSKLLAKLGMMRVVQKLSQCADKDMDMTNMVVKATYGLI